MAERRCVVSDGRSDELLQLAIDERLVLQDRADGSEQHAELGGHRIEALIAAERREQAIERAGANRSLLAREVERAHDELKRVGSLAVELRVAELLNDGGTFLAQERHRGGVGRLIGDQLFGEARRLGDGAQEGLVAVAQARFLARAALHREERRGQLLRLRGDALEQRARAFAGGRLLGPRRLERVDERAKVAVQAFEISGDRVLRHVSLDGKRARFEGERDQQRQRGER